LIRGFGDLPAVTLALFTAGGFEDLVKNNLMPEELFQWQSKYPTNIPGT